MCEIIAIEGNEKVGKSTICERLVRELLDEGFNAYKISFPTNDTIIGREIWKYLKCEIEYEPETIQMLYEIDRQQYQNYMREVIDKFDLDYLIIDRYLLTGIVYGIVRGVDLEWAKALQEKLIKPDRVILLDASVETIVNRDSKYNVDRYDNDLKAIKDIRDTFLWGIKLFPNHTVINADGCIDEVYSQVLDYVLA